MEFAAGPPSRWLVTLKGGSTIEVWADSYCEQDDQLLFEALVEATHDEQRHVRVTSTGRQPATKVLILIAQLPAALVSSVEGGPVDLNPEIA